MSEISISGLSKSYGAAKVIEGLDLEVRDGEFLSLLGPSGCGKTTTLRCIAGLEDPSGGQIRIGSEVVVDAERRLFMPPNRRGLGMVFQSYALWPHMSVFSNVAYPLRVQRRSKAEIRTRTEQALELVGLAHLAHRGTSELSGGQQQRIALARALAGQPRVLLLDEPLSNLDAALRGHMRRELRRIHQEIRRTSIYVTHDQLEAVTLSDRIVVMNKGRIEQIGTPRTVFGVPSNRWVAEFVGFDNFLDAEVLGTENGMLVARPNGWPDAIACVPSAALAGAREGAQVLVAVRSSSFQSGGAVDGPAIPARVVDSTYVGDLTEFSLDAHGTRLTCRLTDRGGVSDASGIGASLTVYLPSGSAVALEKPRDA